MRWLRQGFSADVERSPVGGSSANALCICFATVTLLVISTMAQTQLLSNLPVTIAGAMQSYPLSASSLNSMPSTLTENQPNISKGGLTDATDCVEFSNSGGGVFTHQLQPDSKGVDATLIYNRICPKGLMAPAPLHVSRIDLRYRMKVN